MTEYNIIHNEAESRFETEVEGLISVVDYKLNTDKTIMSITHTGVPKELEGKGIAAALTKFMLQYAEANNIKVNPICPYTKAYMERHSK